MMIDNKIFVELKEWFENYTRGFYVNEEDNEEIDLKYKHSYRVYKNIKQLANNIGLSSDEIIIAKIIGLFHDLGRFEQYKSYKTFSDTDSLDHGQLSVKILKENSLLEELSPKIQEIIYQAILNHNKLNISKEISDQTLLFSRLIRDADKLDIWSIFARRYHNGEDNAKINLELTDKSGITAEIYQRVLNGEPVKYSSLRTVDDFKLIQMGWAYDLNFKESLIMLKERQYLDKIYQSIESKQAREVYEKINTYIDNQVNA